MDLGLKGRRVVVTGGSKGIGYACAESFAREGAELILCARDAHALGKVAEGLRHDYGVVVDTLALDLSQISERERLFAATAEADILVNNAGAIPGGDLFSISVEAWQAAWQLKVFGFIHLTQMYAGRMKQRGGGVVANIIGMASRAPRWNYVCGAAGNAALVAFTHAVGAESPHWGVRVFGINPGPTRTERWQRLREARGPRDDTEIADEDRALPFGRPTEPSEIGRLCVMLCSPLASYLSGTVVDVDGGARFGGPA